MLKLHHLFTDGAVLQRRMPIAVWGWTDANTIVDCELAGFKASTGVSQNGKFLVRFPAIEAGGPHVLTIVNRITGESISARDILIGEVWLASGQSNMEFQMKSSSKQLADFLRENHDSDTLRMFTVVRRAKTTQEENVEGYWEKSIEEFLAHFSAVGGWFGKKLRDTLNVPVGIIHCSWGGTIAEAWTSREMLLTNPDCTELIQHYDTSLNHPDNWEYFFMDSTVNIPRLTWLEKNCVADLSNEGEKHDWHKPEFSDKTWIDFKIPGDWIAQKLSQNGVIWIRKEVELPASWAGKDLQLHMGNIDKQDISYFNGEKIGASGVGFDDSFWDIRRNYSIPGHLVKAGKNLIAVRVYSFLYDGGFGGSADLYFVENPESGEKIPFAGTCRFAVERNDGTPIAVPTASPEEAKLFGVNNPNSPAILFDGMLRPLIPCSMRGVIWYQGESNAHTVEQAKQYHRKIVDLIQDWRFRWGLGNFPFIQVLLANFRDAQKQDDSSTWAFLRDSQRKAMHDLPNVGIASALDCGEIADIHPKDKRTVGERLAAWALKKTYFLPVAGESPDAVECRREGDSLRILFSPCEEGLKSADGKALAGFFIAGVDGIYQEAEASIEGNSVVLRNPEVPFPLSAKYAWADNPSGKNLCSGTGFPALPFAISVKESFDLR